MLPETIATINLPETVTRFFSKVDYALETLREKSIAFIHIKRMNDPFDPYYFLETEFKNRADFLKWVRQQHPAELRLIRQSVSPEGFSAGLKRVQSDFDNRRKSTYLFSTSAEDRGMHPNENLYLWGHYGFGHRGIALEFDTARLARDVLEHGDPDNRLGLAISDVWVKVNYKAQVTPLSHEAYFDFIRSGPHPAGHQESPGLRGITTYLEQTLKTKHTVWRMENEWRLLWSNDSDQDVYRCPISKESVAGIYLGLCVDDGVKERLLQVVNSQMPGVPVAKAEKAQGNFTLKWNRIA